MKKNKHNFLNKIIVQCDELWSDKAGVGFIRVKAEAVKGEISRRRVHDGRKGEKRRSPLATQAWTSLRACLHGGGGPQVGEVARLGGVTRLSIQPLIF